MKKFFLSLNMCLMAFASWANVVMIDGIYYDIVPKAKSAEVTTSQPYVGGDYSGAMVIPESVVYEGEEYMVTSIAARAFNNCNITSIEIPNTVTKIGKEAFYKSSIASIYIPSSLKQIDENAFWECRELASVYISDIAAWCEITFKDLYSNPVSTDQYYNKKRNLYLGEELIEEVEIPNTVTEIKDYAFRNFVGCSSITIPNSLRSVGKNAFDGCSNLKSLYISDIAAWCNITFENEYSNPLCNAYLYTVNSDRVHHQKIDFYLNNQILSELELPSSITEIHKFAFQNCHNLTSVVIPASVINIDEYAFSGCEALTSVVLPQTIKNIRKGVFSDCFGLTQIEIPGSVTTIENNAFRGCSGLTSITIPNSVTSIGNYAFSGCSSFSSVTIPNSVTSIGSGAFEYCKSLTAITLPNGIKRIESETFWGCTALASVSIPNSVTEIISYAFSSCESLSSVSIPNSVTRIANHVFDHCTSLTSIVIPNSVTRIEMQAFGDCTELKKVTIGKSVTYIDYMVFYGCKNLEEVYCYAEKVTNAQNSTFKDAYIDYATLYVPEVSLNSYKTTSPWSDFGTIQSIEAAKINAVKSDHNICVRYADGIINISGLADNEVVEAYDIDGKHICSTRAIDNIATISSSANGNIIMLKIGNELIKTLVK